MDSRVAHNRGAWERASSKHLREYEDLLRDARAHTSLLPVERELLRPLLAVGPRIVHLLSGHGLDDIDLAAAGARQVVGVDFSSVAVGSARRRALELDSPCHYVVAEVPNTPLRDACADVVYSGKGALIWMPDITAWANEVARLLRPNGHLFVYEQHPATPLWTWDADRARIRPERNYFGDSHVVDAYPNGDAIQWQQTLAQIVTAVIGAGLELRHMGEYAEPFWRPGNVPEADAWRGRLPNAFSLMAQRR